MSDPIRITTADRHALEVTYRFTGVPGVPDGDFKPSFALIFNPGLGSRKGLYYDFDAGTVEKITVIPDLDDL
jgi:hypothetical protein